MWKRDEAVRPPQPTSADRQRPPTPGSSAAPRVEPTRQPGEGHREHRQERHHQGRAERQRRPDDRRSGRRQDRAPPEHPDDRTERARSRRRCSPRPSSCRAKCTATSPRPRRVDIRDNGSVDGDLSAPRVAIADGAHFRGSIDMQRRGRRRERRSSASRRRQTAGARRDADAGGASADRPHRPPSAAASARRAATGGPRVAGLFKWGARKAEDVRGAGAGRPLTSETLTTSKVLPQVPRGAGARSPRRSSSISARSSARTSRSSASGSRARSTSRICSPRSRRTRKRDARRARGRRSPRRLDARARRRSTASSAGICSTISTRPTGQALARRAVASCCARAACCYGFFGTTPVDLTHYTRFVVEAEDTLRVRAVSGDAGRAHRAVDARHQQDVRRPDGRRIGAAQEQHPRDPVPQAVSTLDAARPESAVTRSHCHGQAHHCLSERFRHARPLRGRHEGRRCWHLPGRHAGRPLARSAGARHRRLPRSSWRPPTSTFRPARSSSSSSIPASARRAAGIAAEVGDWQVRRARQRRADGGLPGDAAEEGRRADRAALRAADGEPHVRRPRSVRAGGGVAGEGRAPAAFGRAGHRLPAARPAAAASSTATCCAGVVVRIDRFGNVVTNLDRKSCEQLADGVGVAAADGGGASSIARIVSTYSEIGAGEIGALFGSTDHLECAAHAGERGRAAGRRRRRPGRAPPYV